MFEGFTSHDVAVNGVTIHAVSAGSGPPLLLLHGYPQTHVMWHRVAPRLAEQFTVVAADLRGYGDSSKPKGDPDHGNYSKRTMARDNVELMAALGFNEFYVAGHDRGGRVSYRMAFDHPQRVKKLAVLDIVPTYTMFSNVTKDFAMNTYHWFFLAQPAPLPERLIGGDPEFYIRATLSRWSGNTDAFAPEALAHYIEHFSDPACIHGSCEDYRAGATLDVAYDAADLGRNKISCPLLALWGAARGGGADRLAVWREWAVDVQGEGLPCGHFLPEEAPDATYTALNAFFAG